MFATYRITKAYQEQKLQEACASHKIKSMRANLPTLRGNILLRLGTILIALGEGLHRIGRPNVGIYIHSA